MSRAARAGLLCAALGVGSGCTGAGMDVHADGTEQPISYTQAVLLTDGTVYVSKPEDVVEHVELSRRAWSVLWKAVNFGTTEWDLGADLERQLEASNGDAVVNLEVHAGGSWWGFLCSFVPIIPDYLSVDVEADIVRVPGSE